MGSPVGSNCLHHCFVGRVHDSVYKWPGLSFELKWVAASGALEIDGPCVPRQGRKSRRIAIHAEKMLRSPAFGRDAGTLRRTVVVLQPLDGQL